MSNFIDITGQKFNKLYVVRLVFKKKKTKYLCLCDCGKEMIIDSSNLKNGHTKSCGCLNKEKCHQRFLEHGMTGTRFHNIWRGMLGRCFNPNVKCYKNYGGRGIKINKEWLKFENFRDDMLDLYENHIKKFGEKETTIDRIDNNKNYGKKNCKWATHLEQTKNRRKKIK